jgi:replicative DNA helicase
MQLNSNEPIVTFSVPMSQEDAQAWILQKAAEFNTLESLKAKQALYEQEKEDLQRKIEKLDDEIFDQVERCKVIISA